MYPKISVNLGNLLLSFSETLDLAVSSLAMHQQRTAFIAWELSRHAGLSEHRQEGVFLAGLFHDIGALSVEEKVLLHDNNEDIDADGHCIRGQALFESNPWLAPLSSVVRNHHRDWATWHEPIESPIVFDSQILHLADLIEREIQRSVYILHQSDQLCRTIVELSGKQVCKEVVDVFMQVSKREEFWLDLASSRLYSLLLRDGPFRKIEIDLESITVFARLVSMIVDFKSPYTATHSLGVASCAMQLAELMGLSETEVRLMEVAGYLHDLGKLVVPNEILEKPSSLSKAEFAVIKQHTYYTFSVLSTINGLQQLAEWAAYHHERLDGNGYPFKRNAQEISLGARIMAVADIFTALAEDRPYRKGMDLPQIAEILQELAQRGGIESRAVKLLLDNRVEIRKRVMERQEQARDHFQKNFAKILVESGSK